MKPFHFILLFLIAFPVLFSPQIASAAHESMAQLHHEHQVHRAQLASDYDRQCRKLQREYRCNQSILRQQRLSAAQVLRPEQVALMFQLAAQEKNLQHNYRHQRECLKRDHHAALRRLDAQYKQAVRVYTQMADRPCGCESACDCHLGLNSRARDFRARDFQAEGFGAAPAGHVDFRTPRRTAQHRAAPRGLPTSPIGWQQVIFNWMSQSSMPLPMR